MPMKTNKVPFHIAFIQRIGHQHQLLFLRERAPLEYVWYEKKGDEEVETKVWGDTIEEAIRQARRHWKQDALRMPLCGQRFTLPERDEHGSPALFHQMVASYSSPTGIYFDAEVGHNCIVNNASQEARVLWESFR